MGLFLFGIIPDFATLGHLNSLMTGEKKECNKKEYKALINHILYIFRLKDLYEDSSYPP